MGKTIVISSHILPELAELCSTVGIIERGELLFHGSVQEITRRARMGTRVQVRVAERSESAARVLETLEPVKSVQQDNGQLVLELKTDTKDLSFIARALVENNLPLLELREEDVNLETAFMRLTKGIVQ
jgi:ABC-2 type transport system ATP-binding protein